MNAPAPSSAPEIFFDEFRLTAHFQPIVSVARKSVLGYEGLIRGNHRSTGAPASPAELFARATQHRRKPELDRLCRHAITRLFTPTFQAAPGTLLSINFDASVPGLSPRDAELLHGAVRDAGLQPTSVMVEILESDIQSLEGLQSFIDALRSRGFLIAIDDIGAGHSNLNRIPFLKPDVLKIDRYLVQSLNENFYKQAVFRSLVTLARKVGALTVAEGVETQEECLTSIGLGADLIQGYFFSKPLPTSELGSPKVPEAIARMAAHHKRTILDIHKIRRDNLKRYELMTREIQSELERVPQSLFEPRLIELIRFFPLVECLYVLDEEGVQVTEVLYHPEKGPKRSDSLFRPAPKGTDHSLRNYHFMLVEGGLSKQTFVTDPYLSQATGYRCVTFSRLFKDPAGRRHNLCADIDADALERLQLDETVPPDKSPSRKNEKDP